MSRTLNYGVCELCFTRGKFVVTHFCDKLDSCAAGCKFSCSKCGILDVKFLTSWAVTGTILETVKVPEPRTDFRGRPFYPHEEWQEAER